MILVLAKVTELQDANLGKGFMYEFTLVNTHPDNSGIKVGVLQFFTSERDHSLTVGEMYKFKRNKLISGIVDPSNKKEKS